MSAFLYGVLGVLGVIILLGGGFYSGWKVHGIYIEKTKKAAAQELTEQERRRLVEDQKSFNMLVNYNADMAYGRVSAADMSDSDQNKE
jgi:uncharacterized protein YdgA (DUF945 family)